ncbi:MAG: alpha/beta hydrolase [Planctomycetaceae bacterium]|nr:alpha/beta hydrolase [Planctomycetaceae bacterium]
MKIRSISVGLLLAFSLSVSEAREPDTTVDLWPSLPAGETEKNTGEALPRRPNENPPATRVKDITFPRLFVYQPPKENRNGTAVIVFPGGGYNYVVMDKEGSEVADWLNPLGVTVFVAHYRTKRERNEPDPWVRPLEDGQRAVSLIRSQAKDWDVDPGRIGVIGFSAGGQCAALVTTRFGERQYEPVDAVDKVSCRPDFSLLLYPAYLVDNEGHLGESVTITKETPPTFLVHTHDDPITSLSSIEFYRQLKRHQIPAALHIYSNGGHGYGMRPVEGSNVDTWPERATEWLRLRGLLDMSK